MPQTVPAYRRIVEHYERCLAVHGDSHRGVDWPRAQDAEVRYDVMLGVISQADPRPIHLLDFGCGAGHLLEHVRRRQISGISYHGLDISQRFVALCENKFPDTRFTCADVLEDDTAAPEADYVIMNGVFTEKRELSFEDMWSYMNHILRRLWPGARRGMAFNVMSTHVDWERDDLFHLPTDVLMTFLKSELSRHLVIRHDYGLYEYTVYVYREPKRWPA